jgi:hypothetical protein
MALRPAPKRKSVDYQKLDELQKEIFGSGQEEREEENVKGAKTPSPAESGRTAASASETRPRSRTKARNDESAAKKQDGNKKRNLAASKPPQLQQQQGSAVDSRTGDSLGENLQDLETIAARIVSTRAGQGRNTTRPFSVPRTLIIDTTRLKAKFRTIDEQFTQNVIIDFLLREALAAATPENYRELRASAYEFVKRADETTRRSLTVTEEVVYQMSELKAGINLETGRKYSNDEIFSTLLALGVSWLYRTGVLT